MIVYEYGTTNVCLDSVSKSFYIKELNRMSDEGKIKVTHRMAELLGVPVTEKT